MNNLNILPERTYIPLTLIDGLYKVSTQIIAKELNIRHMHIVQLILREKVKFNKQGFHVDMESRSSLKAAFIMDCDEIYLNRDQAHLLLCLLHFDIAKTWSLKLKLCFQFSRYQKNNFQEKRHEILYQLLLQEINNITYHNSRKSTSRSASLIQRSFDNLIRRACRIPYTPTNSLTNIQMDQLAATIIFVAYTLHESFQKDLCFNTTFKKASNRAYSAAEIIAIS